jgi:phage gpG-like protein
MKVNVEFRGARELDIKLKGVVKGLEDFKVPLERAGIEMYKSIEKNFQAGGRPKKWKPHHRLTQKLRPGGRILMDTGRLKNSVTSKGASGSKYELSDDKLVIGSNVKASGSSRLLAEIQQLGQPAPPHKVFGSPGRKGIPPRPFLMIQEEDQKRIELVFNDYIEGLMK